MRVTGIIFFALSLLFFSGCSSTSNQSSLQDELTIYGITLGSTKDDVVDKFGVPTTKKQRDKVIQYKYKDYDFLFANDSVVSITSGDIEFKSNRGIGIGGTYQEVIDAYKDFELLQIDIDREPVIIIKSGSNLIVFNFNIEITDMIKESNKLHKDYNQLNKVYRMSFIRVENLKQLMGKSFEDLKGSVESNANKTINQTNYSSIGDSSGIENTLEGAVYANDIEKVRYLLSNGANPNTTDFEGRSILWIAKNEGFNEIADLLEKSGAKSVDDSVVEITKAIKESDATKVTQLLNNGVDPNSLSGEGYPLLTYSIMLNNLEVTGLLLDRGANPNKTEEKAFMTPLMRAAFEGNMEIVKTLVEAGADVNATNFLGETALMKAVNYDSADVVEYLLSKGANPNLQDNQGKTASDLAMDYGSQQTSNILSSKKIPDNGGGYFRYSFELNDKDGKPFIVRIFSDNESTYVEQTGWAGANEGDRIYKGRYLMNLSEIGKVKGQPLKLFDEAEIEFNSSREMVYKIKSNFSGQPDILVVTQHGSSSGVIARFFYVRAGELRPIKIKWPEEQTMELFLQDVQNPEYMVFKTKDYSNVDGKTYFFSWSFDTKEDMWFLTETKVEQFN